MPQEKIAAVLGPSLIAGLLGGGSAAALTSAGKKREGEDPKERRARILRNALMAGGAGAGAVGLVSFGVDRFKHALPSGDISPSVKALISPWTQAAVTGGGVLGLRAHGIKQETNAMAGILSRLATGNKYDALTMLAKGGGKDGQTIRSVRSVRNTFENIFSSPTDTAKAKAFLADSLGGEANAAARMKATGHIGHGAFKSPSVAVPNIGGGLKATVKSVGDAAKENWKNKNSILGAFKDNAKLVGGKELGRITGLGRPRSMAWKAPAIGAALLYPLLLKQLAKKDGAII